MPEPQATPTRPRRHPWPRILVRLRRFWFGLMELTSFLVAAAGAVASFMLGRWPEPRGRDSLAFKKSSGTRRI